jgi:hypothetical protein
MQFEQVRNYDELKLQLQRITYISYQLEMMKKIHHHLFSILLLFGCCNLNAQQGIGVTLINYTVQNDTTVPLGYTITINAEIRNFDSTQFSGNIDFGLRNNSQVLSFTNTFNKPPYSGNQITLSPLEVIPAIFSVDIDPQYYAPGPDVVVVWPICNQPIADSILIPLNIEGPSDLLDDKSIQFSYTVSSNDLVLFNVPSETTFKQVRILNILGGVELTLENPNISLIPLGNLTRGLLFCEFVTTDEKRRVIKFIH